MVCSEWKSRAVFKTILQTTGLRLECNSFCKLLTQRYFLAETLFISVIVTMEDFFKVLCVLEASILN